MTSAEVQQLRSIFPQKSEQECKAALKQHRSVQGAIEALLNEPQERALPQQQYAQLPTRMQGAPDYQNIPVAYAVPDYSAQQPYTGQPGFVGQQQSPYPPAYSPQYQAAQYAAPQYAAPQYAAPQYAAPQYAAPQYAAPQYASTSAPSAQVQHAAYAPSAVAPPPLTGRRRALLIGINYVGSRAALRGCINDTGEIAGLLTSQYGWRRQDMRIITDDTRECLPTRQNILEACRWLVHDARPGDVFFFSFSGHGAQKEDPHGYEEDGMNETILPLDFNRSGMITDDELNTAMIKDLPSGTKLIAIMDACHSGTGLDLPFNWTGRQWKEDVNPLHTKGDVQMFSGCEDHDVSQDASSHNRFGGAMTTAFVSVLKQNPCPTYPELLHNLLMALKKKGFKQRPVLTSSQRFDFNRPFLIDDIIPNQNSQLGRIFRRKFKAKPHKKVQKFLSDMGIGKAAAVGFGLMMLANAFFD